MATIHNHFYDKIKIMHELSCLAWFIEQHALQDAQKASDDTFKQYLQKLHSELSRNLAELKEQIAECSSGGCKTC